MRKCLIILLTTMFLLVGCGKKEEVVEPPVVYLHQQADSTVWDGVTINCITPCGAFEQVGKELQIFPYFNDANYISLRKIVISDNGFWETVVKDYEGTEDYLKTDKYSLITLSSGTTLAYAGIDDDYAYIAKTATLPSSYVQAVMEKLCQ